MGSKIKLLVDGGKASAGPPLGPALGPLGVNVGQVVAKINEKTASFQGMKVPVTLTVDAATKKFDVEVGTPPTSALVKKQIGIEKAAKTPGTELVGNLPLYKAIEIAKMKLPGTFAKTIKAAVKEVIGTCVVMGITVEGKDPREVQKEIDDGTYDMIFEGKISKEELERLEKEQTKLFEKLKEEKRIAAEKKAEEEKKLEEAKAAAAAAAPAAPAEAAAEKPAAEEKAKEKGGKEKPAEKATEKAEGKKEEKKAEAKK